jgi:Fic family protein
MKRLALHGEAIMRYVWQDKKWPNLTWKVDKLSNLLGKCRFAQGQLLARIQSLGMGAGLEAQAEILVNEAVKTSAIEGAELNPQSVRSSVAKQLGLPFFGLPPSDRYIDGLVEVLLDATTHYSKLLTAERLKGWQAALFPTGFSGMHPVRLGKWRNSSMQVLSGPVGRERLHYEAPPAAKLEKEIAAFLSWWKKTQGKVDGLLCAGIAHFYFVTIHPFDDGNGRIARAITDMALAQDEKLNQRFYSVSSQIMAERKSYYDILEISQKGGIDITAWLAWFLACLERAIRNSESTIATVLAKSEFWQQFAAVPMSDRQRKVVNRLLDAVPDGFEGGLTTRKYVGMCKCSRATAFREIADLVEKGLLKQNEGAGRSVSYKLV